MGQKIKAIGLVKPGNVSVLQAMEIEVPTLAPNDIKVRIKAVSVNPIDTKTRDGGWPLSSDLPWVLGFDASGVVEAVGAEAKRFKVGDEVMFAGSHTRNGTNSEVTVVDERIVGKKPKSLSHTHASALPLVGLTAWEALTEKLGIPENNEAKDLTLLIVNGAGGVGSFATQLARNILNVKNVIVTASRPETIEWCKNQGATHIINHRKPLKEQIDALGLTVDCAFLCFDTNGYLPILSEVVRPFGQIVSIVEVHEPINFGEALFKAQTFHWELMFVKPATNYDVLSQGLILDKIADLIDNGTLKRLDTKTYDDLSVANLREAHETLENGKSIGKIVLTVTDSSFQ
ncbi:hypothetical protein K450DRAFT_245973 [Umbelopsis ramanniana AG]|uniref:Enoyl reductase (ER) domain-containing protein n=1 Tax=Umbelopsis ramanniana AG TaxID=1314678 RepID=A0AAD5HD78_UMBRA|nr:uncharacterized protein K450DRAFT_245973 [Umbelopsis ramanniana AG]KAI8578669.1 hypothetical protein K450DRAFT_245973 [Umbelopsis ramanniana AG]